MREMRVQNSRTAYEKWAFHEMLATRRVVLCVGVVFFFKLIFKYRLLWFTVLTMKIFMY